MNWVLIVMFIYTSDIKPAQVSNINSISFHSQELCQTALKWVETEYMKSGGRSIIKATCVKSRE